MTTRLHLYLYLFLCLSLHPLLFFSSASSQPLYLQRGSEKIPFRDLPDGGKSVVIDGRVYLLVAKDDLATMTEESEAFRALARKNDTLSATFDTLLDRTARYEATAETIVTRQDAQLAQAEKIIRTYDDIYSDLKRLAALSPWSVTAGIGVQTVDTDPKLMGSLGLGYQHWVAQYQFAKQYSGILVGFRLSL